MKHQDIDHIIKENLITQTNSSNLADGFNEKLMAKILTEKRAKMSAKIVSSQSIWILVVLIVLVAVIGFCYYGSTLYSSELYSFSLDLTLFNNLGVKYSLYALMGLLVFSIADKLIQLKVTVGSKN